MFTILDEIKVLLTCVYIAYKEVNSRARAKIKALPISPD